MESKTCPGCGKMVQPTWKKCPYCKTSLAVEENFEEKILAYITAHQGTISVSQCARELGCSEDVVRNTLLQLEQKGKLAKTPPKVEAIQYQVQPPYQPAQPAYQPPPQYPQPPMIPSFQPPTYQPKPKKSRTGLIVGVTLAVVAIVILSMIMYVWVSGFGVSGAPTPQAYLSGVVSSEGKTWVNITWTVQSVSRPDVLWSDIPMSSAKVLDDGATMSSTTFVSYPTSGYVTGGDVITVMLLKSTVASGSVIQLILVHAPTGCTFAQSSITLIYTT